MKHFFAIAGIVLTFSASAQQFSRPEIGTAAWASQHAQDAQQRTGNNSITPLNGSDSLSTSYSNTACGLNYTVASERLGQRFTPIGVAQPAPLVVGNIPACATILKAYLYTEALGVASSITASLTLPNNSTVNYPMTLIGSSVDVCWGMGGTHVWRADVTASVTGNGTYLISGLPVNTSANSTTVDVEGASLVVIYADPSASYTGTIVIDDGCHTAPGGAMTHTMTGINACANSTFAESFMLVGDMQMTGYTITLNNTPTPQPQWNWWNHISTTTSVSAGQNTSVYSFMGGGDCYTFAVAGLYFRTGCMTCTPSSAGNLVLTTSSTPNTCNGNGSASVSVTGGSGNYAYTWSPGAQTTATATNLTAGTYTVSVFDGTFCAQASVTVGNTAMTATSTSTGTTCNSLGSASVTVSGGVGPYTYSWSPSGGNGPTATNLISGIYTCTITDATGCTINEVVTVNNNSSLSVTAYSANDSCPSPSGMVYCVPSGGLAPYTYNWMPLNNTNSIVYNVGPGTYTVVVTDASGCIATATATVAASSFTPSVVAYPNYNPYQCSSPVQFTAWSNMSNATFSWSPATYLDSTTTATPTATPNGATITYTVTATSSCGTATTTVTINPDTTNWQYEDICFVTVDTSINKFVVVWERNSNPLNGTYDIHRETSTAGVYALAGSQPVVQYTTFTDMASNPAVIAERYKLGLTDTCNNNSLLSQHHRPVHLQVSPGQNNSWNLSWTQYEGLPIATYNILRGPALNQMTLLTAVSGNITSYTDLTPPQPPVYYLIEAVHPFGGCAPSITVANNVAQQRSISTFENPISNIAVANPNAVTENQIAGNMFLLQPNPSDGMVDLAFSLNGRGDVNISIFDAVGQLVYSELVADATGRVSRNIDLTRLSAGMYSVRVQTAGTSVQQRLVLTK